MSEAQTLQGAALRGTLQELLMLPRLWQVPLVGISGANAVMFWAAAALPAVDAKITAFFSRHLLP